VLIVDDDHELAAALVEVLESEGYRTTVAHDGRAGLDRVYTQRPDVILLDVEMPQLDGPGMHRRLRAFEQDRNPTPIVLISGVRRLATLATTLGTPYFLQKPFTTDALLSMVEQAVGEKPPSTDQ
jgi:CheY-like chemotaxis protein